MSSTKIGHIPNNKAQKHDGKQISAKHHNVDQQQASSHVKFKISENPTDESQDLSNIEHEGGQQEIEQSKKITNQGDNGFPDDVKEDKEIENKESTTDLASFPAIDAHRLVYHPKPPEEAKQEKKILNLYDFAVIICNFFTLFLAVYYLLVGLTILSYKSSMQSIAIDLVKEADKPPANTIFYTVKGTSTETTSIFLIVSAIFQILNSFLGVYGCVQGYKNILILHIIVSIAFLISELVSGSLLAKDARCSSKDLNFIQEKFLGYIEVYGKEQPVTDERDEALQTATFQLDSVQIGLSCCGAQSWADYLNPDILKKGDEENDFPDKFQVDGTDMVFPSSCCTAWWARNIHCAKGVHLWAHPAVDNRTALKFRQRINQAGCMWRIKRGCQRIVKLAGEGVLTCAFLDIALVIIKGACIFMITKRIWKIIRDKKASIAKETSSYEEDNEEELAVGGSGGTDHHRGLPLPTEDEIELIKARSDFNKFEARVKRTQVGKWMSEARRAIHMTHVKTAAGSSENPYKELLRESKRASELTEETKNLDINQDDETTLNTEDKEEREITADEVLKLEIQKHINKHRERRAKEKKKKQQQEKRDTIKRKSTKHQVKLKD